MTLKNTILGNLRWMLMAKLGCQVISWASTLLVMRILRPEDYGLIAMASALLSLMTMVNEMGLGQAIIQADEIDDLKMRQCFGLVVLVNTASYLVLCLLAPVVAWFFSEEKLSIMIPVIGLQFLVQIFLVIPSALLDRKLQFRERAVYEIGTAVAGTLATLLMAVAGLGVWAIVFGNLGMVVVYTVLINWRFPFAHNKTILGFYSVGVQIATLPLVKISGIFNQLALAGFSRIKNDRDRIRDSVVVVARVASFIAVPVFWGVAAVAKDFVELVLGPTWGDAIFPLQCIALMLPVRVLSIALSQAVNAVGRPDLNVVNLAVACVVMPASFAFGIYQWGLNGISYAWISIYPFWFLYTLFQGLPLIALGFARYFRGIAPPYLLGALMFLTVTVSSEFIQLDQWLRFAILVAIGAVSYGGSFFVFARGYALEAVSTLRKDGA